MQTEERSLVDFATWKLGDKPLIIAGPCSAESFDQVMDTARYLAAKGNVGIFRAGVWKPRTRPGTFEGKGPEALHWLKEVRSTTGLLTAVEVANSRHVELALEAGVDVLWIGARTTVNPFYVQEIADALRGTDIPILIKNPLHPDTDLWVGAIERIKGSGITRVAAVHRGWYTPVAKPYRNEPRWELAVELRLRCPGLTILTDPSHISGRSDMVLQVAQEALGLDMDGLMIEVHPSPSTALSDAAQQLSFDQFDELSAGLTSRDRSCRSREFRNKLEQLRAKIDDIDEQLLAILAARMEMVKEIGIYKKENNVAVLQLERWKEILRTRLAEAEKRELDPDFIYEMLQVIHKTSLALQTGIFHENEITRED